MDVAQLVTEQADQIPHECLHCGREHRTTGDAELCCSRYVLGND